MSKGLKQKELALKIGLSAPSISYYESGEKKPSINNALKIAQVLGVTVDELFNTKNKGGELIDSCTGSGGTRSRRD